MSAPPHPHVIVLPDGRTPSTARDGTPCPEVVLRAIYGDDILTTPPTPLPAVTQGAATTTGTSTGTTSIRDTVTPEATKNDKKRKAEQYEESLKTWWKEYAGRKSHDEDDHASDTLLYDTTHLPRSSSTPPAPTRRLRHDSDDTSNATDTTQRRWVEGSKVNVKININETFDFNIPLDIPADCTTSRLKDIIAEKTEQRLPANRQLITFEGVNLDVLPPDAPLLRPDVTGLGQQGGNNNGPSLLEVEIKPMD